MTDQINKITPIDVAKFEAVTVNPEYDTLDFYQRIATKSAIYPGKGTPFGLMYCALGLAEAGEVQNKVKKVFRDDGAIQFGEAITIMEVTSVSSPRYYGRNEHGEPTNCAARDVVATLQTGERAQAVLAKVREMEKTRRERNAVASKACSAAYRANDEWFAEELKRTLAT